MKRKSLIVLAAMVVSLAASLSGSAQEPTRFDFLRPDSLRTKGFKLPDSLAHLSPWRQEYREIPRKEETQPAVSMTSIVAIPWENMPKRITVLPDNTLRLTPHLTIGNGQAWNWGPFPNSYLDARTLSFPLPR